MMRSLTEKFFEKVQKGSSCWLWKADDGHGYGHMTVNGRTRKATHVAWFLATGKWPMKFVLHSCDNPPCVRKGHLFLGGHLENMRDMFSKGRRIAAVGKKNGRSKLTKEKVLLIRRLYAAGQGSTRLLAKRVGISYITVRSVLVGRQWKWVPCSRALSKAIKKRLRTNHRGSFVV